MKKSGDAPSVQPTGDAPVKQTKGGVVVQDSNVLRKGQILLAKYEVLALLSQGGFGQVYTAREEVSEDVVAIKAEPTLIRTSLFANERGVHQALADNPHPNFLQYYGEGRTSNCRFLVMQLCGKNLRDAKKCVKGDKLSRGCSLHLAVQMVQAVRHLHDVGFVHRDIKPANFCVGLPGTRFEKTVYLLDFGLSKRHLDYKGQPVPVRPGKRGFRGTPRYASIRILQGRDMARVDDLWSVLYIVVEQVLGSLPWRAVADREVVLQMKLDIDYTKAWSKCPQSYKILWEHLNMLEYACKPDYQHMIQAFEDDIRDICGNGAVMMDWQ